MPHHTETTLLQVIVVGAIGSPTDFHLVSVFVMLLPQSYAAVCEERPAHVSEVFATVVEARGS